MAEKYNNTSWNFIKIIGLAWGLSFCCTKLYADSAGLSSVKMNERASANEFDYTELSNGLDRTTKTNKNWHIQLTEFQNLNSPDQKSHKATSAYYGGLANGFGYNKYFQGPREWGYAFHRLTNGENTEVGTSGPFNGFYTLPTNKSSAYSQLKDWFNNKMLVNEYFGSLNWRISKNGHYFYHHYAAQFAPDGIDMIGSEVGENIVSANMHNAFARGAARQYDKTWATDVSNWWVGKIADYSAYWTMLSSGGEYQLEGDRVGLLKRSQLLVKKGAVNSNWVVLANNVRKFALEGNRIAITKPNRKFLIKSGSLNSNWKHLADSVDKFVLEGNRIAVLINGNLSIKEGALNSNWVNISTGSIVKFWLSNRVVVALNTSGELFYSSGVLTPKLKKIATGITEVALEGKRILVEQSNGDLRYRNDIVNDAWNKGAFASNVIDFSLSGSRIAILKKNGKLKMKASNFNERWVTLADQVSSYKIAGDRIAILQNDSSFSVKEGALNTNWVPMAADTMHSFSLVEDGVNSRIAFQTSGDKNLWIKTQGLTENENVSHPVIWGAASGPVNGHSLNFTKRSYLGAYMQGANVLLPEGGNVNYFLGNYTGPSNTLTLSPLGKVGRDVYKFTHTTLPPSQRGLPWAPIAIMIDKNHGLGLTSWGGDPKVFDVLPPNNSDLMNISLLKSIWGNSLFESASNNNESQFQNNTPNNEIFDILTEDAAYNVLENYPVIILSGEIRPDLAMRSKLIKYVEEGGNLIINSQMMSEFNNEFTGLNRNNEHNLTVNTLQWLPDGLTVNKNKLFNKNLTLNKVTLSADTKVLMRAVDNLNTEHTLVTQNSFGQGRVMVVTASDLRDKDVWEFLITQLANDEAVNPFKVTGDVEYLVNYKGNDIWYVTLINNKGVNKTNTTIESLQNVFHPVSFTLQESGKAIASVTEVTNYNNEIIPKDKTIDVTLRAGDFRVYKITTY